jgi:RNA-directed DNA polymerase
MRKVWKEIDGGGEWIVDGDLKDFFGSVDHEKLLTLVAQRVADSRVLRLITAMLKAGSYGQGKLFPSERGTPQGGVASPLLSNILLTPFDQEMGRKGYQLTRFADDWVITCKSAAEARAALAAATRILEQLGVRLNPQKTRIVHIQQGFDFLGYRMVRTSGNSKISPRPDSAMEPKRADRISHTQINPTIPGSGADVDATQCSAQDSGADTRAESDSARLG